MVASISKTQLLREKVAQFSRNPGVYLMKNHCGEILYVGKASDLRARVSSYFSKESAGRYQVQFLMSKVSDIEPILTANSKEALLLENTLIKKHRPRYNIELKDDKSYVSLKLSIQDDFPRLYVTRRLRKDGSLYYGPYTRVGSVREMVDFIERHFRLRTCSDHELRNRVRPCLQHQIHRCDAPCMQLISKEEYKDIVEEVRLFLEGKSGRLIERVRHRMQAAADREAYEEAAHYRNLLKDIESNLEKQRVVSQTIQTRDVFGYHREGEKLVYCLMMVRDGSLQDQRHFFFKTHEELEDHLPIFLLQYYESGVFIPPEILLSVPLSETSFLEEIFAERSGHRVSVFCPQRGEKVRLVEIAQANAQQALLLRQQKERDTQETASSLQRILHLQNLPSFLECYDISNFQGKDSVGSMVTFREGKPFKEGYRHFKIKWVEGSNDFASLYEMIYRRLKRGLEDPQGKWAFPDLIIIDGGKGQLNAAFQAMKDLGVQGIDLVALAKSRLEQEPSTIDKTVLEQRTRSEERVFVLGRKDPIFFPQNSSALYLLVKIRDEAHRFGILHHRQTRQKRSVISVLDQVKGIGKVRRRKLLQRFGSLRAIKEAKAEDIAKAIGVSEEMAHQFQQNLSLHSPNDRQ